MIRNFSHYIKGTVKIKVSGPMPERFINLCVMQDIFLWGISKTSEGLFVCMSLSDFFSIRPIVRNSKSYIKVVDYYGFPFIAKKIKKRKMMVIGAILFLLVLNTLLSYIWFIDIVGTKSIPVQQIRDIVYKNGLRPGILKNDIPVKSIENQVTIDLPEVAWIGIRFTGIHAVVEVVEKTVSKPQDKAPADIVAAKDGVITEIIVLAGQNAVKKGDTVKKGDILIKGVSYEGVAGELPAESSLPQYIRAKGIIKARVWYEGYGESELVSTVYERTGRQEIGVTLKFGQQNFQLKRVELKPDCLVEVETFNKKLFWWRNHDIIVESTINTYYELSEKKVEISVEEAREQSKAKAFAFLQALIPETAHVLARNIEVLQIPEKKLVRVKVNVETVEDIGEVTSVTKKDEESTLLNSK